MDFVLNNMDLDFGENLILYLDLKESYYSLFFTSFPITWDFLLDFSYSSGLVFFIYFPWTCNVNRNVL